MTGVYKWTTLVHMETNNSFTALSTRVTDTLVCDLIELGMDPGKAYDNVVGPGLVELFTSEFMDASDIDLVDDYESIDF